MICDDCLNYFERLVRDKGQRICQGCYGKRYNRKQYKLYQVQQRSPTLKDLKRYLEKDW